MSWKYRGKNFKEPKETDFGFVYKITLPDGTYYIGQKQFWSNKKRIIGKRELAARGKSAFRKYRQKGKKKEWVYYEEQRKQSNWQDYYGSEKGCIIQEHIKKYGKEHIKREIVKIVRNKINLTYWEAKYLFCEGVLLSDKALNMNVLGKFYKNKIEE